VSGGRVDIEALTTWLEVAAVVLLVACVGVAGWTFLCPAAGLGLSGLSCAAFSAVLNFVTRPRRSA
jgi:hypothetical protein